MLALCAAPASAVSSDKAHPPGVNDWSCTPTAAHPRPVVLVHGLTGNGSDNWVYLGPKLVARGYCVYSLTYGVDPLLSLLASNALVPGGTIPIEQSAKEFGAFVDKVLAATGATQVDLVGHSEGTVMPQYWMKFLGGASKVDRYVAMTPIYHGTTLQGLSNLVDLGYQYNLGSPLLVPLAGLLCGSCPEFLAGSAFNQHLNANGYAVPGVEYTTIMTTHDELVTPYTSGYLPGAVHNWVLQDLCPADPSEHVAVAFDPVAAQLTFNALDPEHARPISCDLPYPVIGTPPAP
ncbi:alpha/beta fold hydrolase [Nocardioides ultimimeridianus]